MGISLTGLLCAALAKARIQACRHDWRAHESFAEAIKYLSSGIASDTQRHECHRDGIEPSGGLGKPKGWCDSLAAA